MTKTCSKCCITKEITEFANERARPDGLSPFCKSCNSKRCREWYVKNSSRAKSNTFAQQKRRKVENTEFVTKVAKEYGCRLCGERDVVVLQFHHMGDKHHDISYMKKSGYTLEKLKKEINKCVVLCSNCHCRVHAKTATVSTDMMCVV